MKDFLSHLYEQDIEDLSEAKKKKEKETEGHKFQKELLGILQSSIPANKRDKITFTSAGVGSTSADIKVTHADYPNQPLHIECKVGVSQGGALTWNYDGSDWSISPSSRNAPAICGGDPVFCTTMKEILGTPTIMNRVHKIIARHAHVMPQLMTNRIPFTTVPEIWKPVLNDVAKEIQAEAFDHKSITWRFPVEKGAYWRTLNSMMHGSHLLVIKGMGTLLVGGATFPEAWFMASPTLLSAPRIDMVTADAGGMAEARFKRSGSNGATVIERNRQLFIVAGTKKEIGPPPKDGDKVRVIGLKKATNFDRGPSKFGVYSGSADIRYIVSNGEKDDEDIGRIVKIHSSMTAARKTGSLPQVGYNIVCDFSHSAQGVTFETNLRLNDINIPTPVNLELKPSIFANCIV